MREGVEGLTRDKTRPPRIPALPLETVDRVVALTNQAPVAYPSAVAQELLERSCAIPFSPAPIPRLTRSVVPRIARHPLGT